MQLIESVRGKFGGNGNVKLDCDEGCITVHLRKSILNFMNFMSCKKTVVV